MVVGGVFWYVCEWGYELVVSSVGLFSYSVECIVEGYVFVEIVVLFFVL